MTVYFHGSFGLNRTYMAGILAAALKNNRLKDDSLAKPFGYGAPFGARYRSWLHKTGLTHMRLPMKLTEMGAIVFENDPKLATMTTKWFLHHELTGDEERAEPWHYFVNEFLPSNKEFTKDELLAGLTNKLRAHSEQHFGPGSKLNQVILRKIIECYTEERALGSLGLVQIDGNKLSRSKTAKKQGPWKTVSSLARAYSTI